jgi:hypothetical protein
MSTSINKPSLTFAVYRGETFVFRQTVAQDIVKIGRDPRSHVPLECDLASRMHAVIEVTSPSDVTLIDLGNEPGTTVNGERIAKRRLVAGDAIGIGSQTLKLERIESPLAARAKRETERPADDGRGRDEKAPVLVASAVPAPIFSALSTQNPFFAAAAAATAPTFATTVRGANYTMVKSGPDVSPEEVELFHVAAVEVKVMWGGNVLQLDQLSPPRSWSAGDSGDFLVDADTIGTDRLPVVVSNGASVRVVVPEGASGTLEIPGQAPVALSELVASGRASRSSSLANAHEVELPARATARVTPRGTDITFEVTTGNAGKPIDKGLFATLADGAQRHIGLSLLAHAGILASLAFFMPKMSADDADAMDRDQILLMQKYLAASAERERERVEEEASGPSDATGGTGARAPGAEGQAGNPNAPVANARFAVKKTDDGDPRLARERAKLEAADFGMVGLLATFSGAQNGPVSPWGAATANGPDAVSAAGNMWGTDIGESFGWGLGLSGVGEGGGCGPGQSCGMIGMGDVGTVGHGRGLKDGQGFGPGGWGSGAGPLKGNHDANKAPRMRPETTTVSGHIPEEVIQRIVRQNFGRFRLCYENGLRQNPSLSGRVATKFVIGRDGAVMMSADAGSDLPDQAVVSCVVRGFSNLSFPAPDGGTVKVIYPIVFTPGDG